MLELLSTKIGRAIGLVAVGGVALLAFVVHERTIGARHEIAKTAVATTKTIAKGDAAAVRSRDPHSRRLLDPSTVD